MALRILIAGCSDEERARLEPLVRAVIGESGAADGPWHMSLVKVGKKLSATLSGPGMQKAGFVVSEQELRGSILETMREAGLLGPTTSAPAPAPGEPARESSEVKQDQHACTGCQKAYVVVYEARADEAQTNVPVACPHCWQVNQVPVGEWAAVGEEYRAGKIRGDSG